MKSKYIKSLMAAALLFSASACEDYLDQEVVGQFSEEDFYQTDGDAMQATTAIYDMMQAHYSADWSSEYMLKTLPSDESNAGGSGPGDQPEYQTLDDFTFDSQNDAVEDVWAYLYSAIYLSNKVVNNVEPDTELKTRLIAEAKALRAYHYLELVTLWGEIPLVLTDVQPGQYEEYKRRPKADIYEQIEKDLNEAIATLPSKVMYSDADKFRISKEASQAILGRAHLYQEEWQAARDQFEAVISTGIFGLESSVGAAFSEAGEFGKESLLEVNYINTEGYDWGNFPWDWRPESNIHVQLMGPRADFYSMAPGDSLIGGWGFNTPTAKMYNAFSDDDERKLATVMSEAELEALGGEWTNPDAYEYEGYFQRKYATYSSQTGAPVGELNYGTNWRLVRYADVLLMAAEAHYRAGDETTARDYINQVRRRSELDEISASGAALFDALVKERQLELAFEGFRYVDLVRWGLAEQELGPLGYMGNRHSVMPIPEQERRISGLGQNDNY